MRASARAKATSSGATRTPARHEGGGAGEAWAREKGEARRVCTVFRSGRGPPRLDWDEGRADGRSGAGGRRGARRCCSSVQQVPVDAGETHRARARPRVWGGVRRGGLGGAEAGAQATCPGLEGAASSERKDDRGSRRSRLSAARRHAEESQRPQRGAPLPGSAATSGARALRYLWHHITHGVRSDGRPTGESDP